MVVLAPGREIGPADLPPHIRDADALGMAAGAPAGGGRLLPVPVGPLVREGQRAEGRELEFIVRGLLELKLQVEELRRRLDEERAARQELAEAAAAGAFAGPGAAGGLLGAGGPPGLEARDAEPPPNVVTVAPGMTMAAVERAVIEAALRETGGNRRRAAELLGIGERTLYRKLSEYQGGAPAADLATDVGA
jgi:DNA-binding NtrC family response regulator